MLIVNRIKEKGTLSNDMKIGINSMGFAGSFYARNKEEAESIKITGIL